MNYIGTRGFSEPRSFAGALLDGLAPDGGLYVPQTYPQPGFDLAAAAAGDYGALTEKLLTLFGVDVLGAEAVTAAAARTKAAFLRMTPSGGQTPLTQLDDNLWLLELYHGPTLAFKDMAMQMIAPLTDAALAQTGEKLTLVTATSGDILDSPYEKGDRYQAPMGVAEKDAKPFLGSNFQTTLRDLEARMREAAGNLEFEEAARLRDEIKRLKTLDLAFAKDMLDSDG